MLDVRSGFLLTHGWCTIGRPHSDDRPTVWFNRLLLQTLQAIPLYHFHDTCSSHPCPSFPPRSDGVLPDGRATRTRGTPLAAAAGRCLYIRRKTHLGRRIRLHGAARFETVELRRWGQWLG